MPLVTLYRLRLRGPMRFGARGIGMEDATPFPSAATFFGAWCWAIRDLAGGAVLERMLAAFAGREPPFLLAAPMPSVGSVLLMPRPFVLGGGRREEHGPVPPDKRVRRYRWVEESLWFRLVGGESVEAAFRDEGAFHQGQTIWAAGGAGDALRERLAALGRDADAAPGDLAPSFWRVAVASHVAVDRGTRAGAVYGVGATWFAPDVDLVVPVRWIAEGEWRETLERALAMLGETGIGGERSAGYGQFDLGEAQSRTWPDVGAERGLVTLSGYHPVREEVPGVFAPPAAYALEMNRGWVERGTSRHAVRLVSAGSVLRTVGGRAVYGEMVDVTPLPTHPHRVYRYGYAFPLPAAIDQGG